MSLSGTERETVVAFVTTYPNVGHAVIDCSHFVCSAIRQVRPNFPYMTSAMLAQQLTTVNVPVRGDIIYFSDPGHVAILIMDNDIWFVGSQTSTGICGVKSDNQYWRRHAFTYLQVS